MIVCQREFVGCKKILKCNLEMVFNDATRFDPSIVLATLRCLTSRVLDTRKNMGFSRDPAPESALTLCLLTPPKKQGPNLGWPG